MSRFCEMLRCVSQPSSVQRGRAILRVMRRLWVFLLLALLLAAPPAFRAGQLSAPLWGQALADDDDDDDPDEDDDDDDRPRQPRPAAPAPISRLSQLAASLRPAAIWVERSGSLVRIRCAVSYGGTLVGTLTLHPSTGQPVEYAQRGLAQPRPLPSAASLNNVLARLLAQAPAQLRAGQYAVASASGPSLPLYWGGRLVAYISLDSRGQPRQDPAVVQAYLQSSLKVRR